MIPSLTPVNDFTNLATLPSEILEFVRFLLSSLVLTKQTFTCSKSTIEALEKGMKYAQS